MKAFLVVLGLVLSSHVMAYPTTFLEMTSETGDYIGLGRDYYFTEDHGAFHAWQPADWNPNNLNRTVSLSFRTPNYSDRWSLSFSTHELGIDLTEGTYSAVRYPFEPVGSAGMNISGNSRGSNRLTGIFTILDIDFGLNGLIDSFAATFEQHSEGRDPALFGKIAYNSDAFSVDEPSSFYLLGLGCISLIAARARSSKS